MVFSLTEKGPETLRVFDEFSASAPDELSTAALLLTAPNGNPAVAIAVCYAGALDDGEKLVRPLRTFTTPLADLLAPQPYTQMQTLFDEAWPPGRRYYNKSSIVRRITDAVSEALVEDGRTMPTPISAIALPQLPGTARRVAADATAFPHRYDHLALYVHPATDDPAESDQIVRWGRETWTALQPFVEPAVYVNALEDAREEGAHRVEQEYGGNYARLTALKKTFDPTNFYSQNQNIRRSG